MLIIFITGLQIKYKYVYSIKNVYGIEIQNVWATNLITKYVHIQLGLIC